MSHLGSYYCHGCNNCEWEAEGHETSTSPARRHHAETGHTAYSERTTVFVYEEGEP